MAIDPAKLKEFVNRSVADLGAGMSAALVVLGDRLGLFKAMAGAGPLTSAELVRRTGTAERYVREWLLNQAAGGYMTYDPVAGTYTLPAEQALALEDEDSEAFLPGNFQVMAAMFAALPRLAVCFRTAQDGGEAPPGCEGGRNCTALRGCLKGRRCPPPREDSGRALRLCLPRWRDSRATRLRR
jgi:winged helix-turn-helix protein